MAVETVKSGSITNRDAVPQVKNSAFFDGGMLREVAGMCEVSSGANTSSKYILFQIPSKARVSSLRVYSDAIGTASAADFGLWDTTANGGAVVDADFFASAVVLTSILAGTDVAHEAASTGLDADDAEKTIWNALGLSSDPNKMYDVVAQLTAGASAAGTLSAKCSFVV